MHPDPSTRPRLRLRLPPPSRRRAWALPLSLAVHALLIALVASSVRRDWNRTPVEGPIAITLPSVGGGGGGSREAYITAPSEAASPPVRPPPPQRPVVAPPVVVPPVVTPPPAAVPPVESPDTEPTLAAATPDSGVGGPPGGGGPGAGPGTGGGAGGGIGQGTGAGAGPGHGEGRGQPPEPRQLVIPPSDFPKELRGRRIEVTFFVASDGRVEDVRVVPPITNGGFARKFDETMRNYRFRPARSPAGAPIAGSTTITVSF